MGRQVWQKSSGPSQQQPGEKYGSALLAYIENRLALASNSRVTSKLKSSKTNLTKSSGPGQRQHTSKEGDKVDSRTQGRNQHWNHAVSRWSRFKGVGTLTVNSCANKRNNRGILYLDATAWRVRDVVQEIVPGISPVAATANRSARIVNSLCTATWQENERTTQNDNKTTSFLRSCVVAICLVLLSAWLAREGLLAATAYKYKVASLFHSSQNSNVHRKRCYPLSLTFPGLPFYVYI